MSQALDPYYYSSRMRELSGQKELTTGRGLTQGELESILNAELSQRYTAEQNRRQQRLQEKALDIQSDAAKDAAKAAEMGGYAQLAVAGGYVGSKAPAIYETGKKAYDWAVGAPAISTVSTAAPMAIPAGTTAGAAATKGQFLLNAPTVAGTEAGIGSTALGIAAPLAVGYGVQQLTEEALGERGSYAASGATMGTMIGGPVGAMVGAGVGYVVGTVKDISGTVICTELSRQGYIPKEVLTYEYDYRIRNIDTQAYMGYRQMADPIVRLMQKSKLITWMILPFGRGVAYEMAHRANPDIKGSRIGCFILKHGLPLCRWVARRRVGNWQTS